jgi:hypothetical protein
MDIWPGHSTTKENSALLQQASDGQYVEARHPSPEYVGHGVVTYLLRSPRQRVDKEKFVELSNSSAFSGPILRGYLQQTVLLALFMLGMGFNAIDNVIDWDCMLAPGQIVRFFGENERVLAKGKSPKIRPIGLADDSIELLLEPYKLDIENLDEVKMICLLTGRLLSPNQFQFGTKFVGELGYVDPKWNAGPSSCSISLDKRQPSRCSYCGNATSTESQTQSGSTSRGCPTSVWSQENT